MRKRVADIVVDTLIENGVTQSFSVVGGGAMHLNNAFALKRDVIKTLYNHHEQASAMAAEAYARLTGKIAAVCVTSGPGGLNTLNGVQSAWVDSLPMIVIAGHPRYDTTVNASGLDVRCIGVQENDIIPQVSNITKYAKMVIDPLSVKREVKKALDIALDGRRGPVWLSIPLDVQGTIVEESELYEYETFISSVPEVSFIDIAELADRMSESKRPCILTGSAIRTSNSEKEYRDFTKMMDIPIVGGYGAPDNNFCGERNYYGISGSLGPRCGNFIIQNSDFILVLGNSLSTNQTGFNVGAFASNADIYMIDAQPDESKKKGLNIKKCIYCDLKDFFQKYISFGKKIKAPDEWRDYCDFLYEELPRYEVLDYVEKKKEAPVHPAAFWKLFLEKAEDNAVFALGNSSSIQELLKSGVTGQCQRVIGNYHSGSMGIDLPFAIGAAAAGEECPVYCITGDGCFMMNIQELQTIKYNKMGIKIVVFNNDGYDNIRMTCRNYFDGLGNGCDSESGISMPDFRKVAEAFGYEYYRVSTMGELSDGIAWLISRKDMCLLEIIEKQDKERAPVMKSVMDENGVFTTPAFHIMSPLLSTEQFKAYTKFC